MAVNVLWLGVEKPSTLGNSREITIEVRSMTNVD